MWSSVAKAYFTTISFLPAAILVFAGIGNFAIAGTNDIDNTTYINANSILMFVTNQGIWGQDMDNVFGYQYGTFYPYSTVEAIENGTMISSPLYSVGLCVGGIDDATGDTLVAVAMYDGEYVPGPMASGTYQPDNPAFKVYCLYAESLAANPNADYLNWPVDQGAPVDDQGLPTMMSNPVNPGEQLLWAVFNDADSAMHVEFAGGTRPLGMEVQQTVWASPATGYETVIYIMYKIYNKGDKNLSDCYVSLFTDPDVGGMDDDFAGCNSLNNLGYAYNASDMDMYYGSTPPAIGFKFLRGPLVPSPGDSAYFDRCWIPGYRNLGMTAFMRQVPGLGPQSYAQLYNYMKGLYSDGGDYINPENGLPTTYWCSGDPTTGTGDLDFDPSDRQMRLSAGPFDFAPGDSQYVLIKMAVGQGGDRLTSISDLWDVLNEPEDLPLAINHEPSVLPDGFSLKQNYPNPFNPATIIEYSLPVRSNVVIDIFNIVGQKVSTIVNQNMSAGTHSTVWNGTNNEGKPVTTGLYFYRITAGDFSQTRKMLLLK